VLSLGAAALKFESPSVIMGDSCGCPGLCALEILRPIPLKELGGPTPLIGEEECPPFIFGEGTFWLGLLTIFSDAATKHNVPGAFDAVST
jgi:hypothetical protein